MFEWSRQLFSSIYIEKLNRLSVCKNDDFFVQIKEARDVRS